MRLLEIVLNSHCGYGLGCSELRLAAQHPRGDEDWQQQPRQVQKQADAKFPISAIILVYICFCNTIVMSSSKVAEVYAVVSAWDDNVHDRMWNLSDSRIVPILLRDSCYAAMVVMTEMGIRHFITADAHFTHAGIDFSLLP